MVCRSLRCPSGAHEMQLQQILLRPATDAQNRSRYPIFDVLKLDAEALSRDYRGRKLMSFRRTSNWPQPVSAR